MKKIIAMVLSGLVAVSSTFALGTLGIRGSAGMGFGTEINNFDSSWEMNYLNTMSFNGGVFFNIPVASGFGIQPEVDYTYNMVGYLYKTIVNNSLISINTTDYTTYSYSTIDIPVNITFKAGNLTLLAGPVFTIPVGDITKTTKTVNNNNNSSSQSSTTLVLGSSFIMGMDFGAEYGMRVGSAQGFIGARYNLDFMPMQQKTTDSDGNATYEALFTRRYLSVELGIRLAL